MLAYQQTITHSLIHFVALEVIIEFPKLYFEALVNGHLKQLLHHPAKVFKRGNEIDFWERTSFHKVARVLYKILRCFYVSVIYYFIPYTMFFVHWSVEPAKSNAEE